MLNKLDQALSQILVASGILLHATTKRTITKRLILHTINCLEKALVHLRQLVAS